MWPIPGWDGGYAGNQMSSARLFPFYEVPLILFVGWKFREQALTGHVIHTQGPKLKSTCKASVHSRAGSVPT